MALIGCFWGDAYHISRYSLNISWYNFHAESWRVTRSYYPDWAGSHTALKETLAAAEWVESLLFCWINTLITSSDEHSLTVYMWEGSVSVAVGGWWQGCLSSRSACQTPALHRSSLCFSSSSWRAAEWHLLKSTAVKSLGRNYLDFILFFFSWRFSLGCSSDDATQIWNAKHLFFFSFFFRSLFLKNE